MGHPRASTPDSSLPNWCIDGHHKVVNFGGSARVFIRAKTRAGALRKYAKEHPELIATLICPEGKPEETVSLLEGRGV